MTILDVLRYPVTDIYNLDELDALPAALFIDWVTECSGKSREHIAQIAHIESKIGLTRESIVHSMILMIVQRETGSRNSHRNTGWAELYKAKCLKRLKEMIAAYEPV